MELNDIIKKLKEFEKISKDREWLQRQVVEMQAGIKSALADLNTLAGLSLPSQRKMSKRILMIVHNLYGQLKQGKDISSLDIEKEIIANNRKPYAGLIISIRNELLQRNGVDKRKENQSIILFYHESLDGEKKPLSEMFTERNEVSTHD